MEHAANKVSDLNEFVNALGALAVLEGKMTKRPTDAEFIQKLKVWATGLFRIVVMGEIKKGKSSFINALLGVRDLVPVSSNVATSTIFKICYGEKIAYKVFFTEESKKPSVLIDKDALPQYGTEDGNPGNEKQVDFIQVFVPSAFLKGGLVIIDTPGLGGLFKQHKRITYEYVPKADAVFMVSDSVESPIGQAEIELLEDLKKVTDQIFFVQTKAMAVDTEARQARERNNRRTLANHGFDEASLRYFVVDSHLKHDADEAQDREDLIDSGFIPLTMFVNNEIKANVRRQIMRTAIKVAMPKFAVIEDALASEEKILSADNDETRKQIAAELTAAEDDLAQWQRYELPRLQDRVQDGMREIRTKVGERTRKFRPGGEVQEVVNQTISECPDIETLFQRLTEFNDNAANCFTQARHEILAEVRSAVEQLLSGLGSCKFAVDTNVVDASRAGEVEVNVEPVKRAMASNDPAKASFFEDARTQLYGGMAGTAIASAIGGILGSVVPGIGTIIGSTAGMLVASALGMQAAVDIKDARDLEKAKQQALSAVAQTIASASQNLNEGIQRVLADIESSVMRALRDAAMQRQEDIVNRRKELQQRQSETTARISERRTEIANSRREFSAIKSTVSRAV